VPFAALTDGDRYFGQEHELYVLPSASALPFIERNAAPADGSSVVVFGDPATDVADLTPLAYAREEATAVAGLFGAPVYTGSEASEARLSAEAGGAKVIHLAAHGQYNRTNSLYSTIYLAPGGEADGQLQVQEVYDLDLKADQLVVLSACETNVGAVSSGDDVVGLTRAFFFAGAPTVISSLWAVNDAATGALMTAFYRHWLQDGMSKAGALQAAQADVRGDARWSAPFFWAGFVLNGDPGEPQKVSPPPVPLPESPTKRTGTRLPFVVLGVAGVALVAVAAMQLVRRQRVR